MENEEEKIYNNLEKSNKTLQEKDESLLKGDECSEHFHDKNHMRTHILTNHAGSVVKCNVCENSFKTKNDMKTDIVMHSTQSK